MLLEKLIDLKIIVSYSEQLLKLLNMFKEKSVETQNKCATKTNCLQS